MIDDTITFDRPTPKPVDNPNNNTNKIVPPWWKRLFDRLKRLDKLRGKKPPSPRNPEKPNPKVNPENPGPEANPKYPGPNLNPDDPAPGIPRPDDNVPGGPDDGVWQDPHEGWGRPLDEYPLTYDPLEKLDMVKDIELLGIDGGAPSVADSLELIYRPDQWSQARHLGRPNKAPKNWLPREELQEYLEIEDKARNAESVLEKEAQAQTLEETAEGIAGSQGSEVRRLRNEAAIMEAKVVEGVDSRNSLWNEAVDQVGELLETDVPGEYSAEVEANFDKFRLTYEAEVKADLGTKQKIKRLAGKASKLDYQIRQSNPIYKSLLEDADRLHEEKIKAISEARKDLLKVHWANQPEMFAHWLSQWDGGFFWDKGTTIAQLTEGKAEARIRKPSDEIAPDDTDPYTTITPEHRTDSASQATPGTTAAHGPKASKTAEGAFTSGNVDSATRAAPPASGARKTVIGKSILPTIPVTKLVVGSMTSGTTRTFTTSSTSYTITTTGTSHAITTSGTSHVITQPPPITTTITSPTGTSTPN